MNGCNPFPGGKRYRTLSGYLKERFGCKVFKVPLNGGFTCPNRDGTKGFGGCSYCSPEKSGEFAGNPAESLAAQFEAMRGVLHKKWRDALYIPYFQAGTNTYAPVETLRALFDQALTLPGAVGLRIATRADCLDAAVLALLEALNKRTYLVVELGLQTVHDATAARVNRCHDFAEFLAGYQALARRGIAVCVHLINGLPGETFPMMLETARVVGTLSPHAVKIHLLHVLKHTALAADYARGLFEPLTREDYVGLVCEQLAVLPPSVIIERLTGDGKAADLIAPRWSADKFPTLNAIDKTLTCHGIFQGDRADAPIFPF
ncbi:MAG: TIGR01212 family radical SAM protein [Oscillospiraceae bacterium]